MFRENCLPHQENLASYSLGALDADEFLALESHLENCVDCKTELVGYRKIATGLLHSLPPQTPPSNLRRKLTLQLPSARTRTPSLFALLTPQFSFGQLANAALLVILIGLNVFSAMQVRDLREQQIALAERVSAEQAAISMLAYPNTQILLVTPDVQDLTGSVLLDRDRTTAVLLLWNLPKLDAAQIYQIWLIDADGKRFSAGLFIPTSGQDYTTVLIEASVPLKEYTAIGVTIEPSGGSEQPTGSRLLVVEL